jgi:hypothetical protein
MDGSQVAITNHDVVTGDDLARDELPVTVAAEG